MKIKFRVWTSDKYYYDRYTDELTELKDNKIVQMWASRAACQAHCDSWNSASENYVHTPREIKVVLFDVWYLTRIVPRQLSWHWTCWKDRMWNQWAAFKQRHQ